MRACPSARAGRGAGRRFIMLLPPDSRERGPVSATWRVGCPGGGGDHALGLRQPSPPPRGGPNAQARPWTPLPHEETRSLPTGAGQLRPRSTDTRLACAEGQLGLSPPGRPSSSGSGPRPLPARGHLRLSWAPHRGLAWQREPRPTSRGLRRAGRPAQLCCSGRGLALEACRRPHTLRIASLCAFKRFRSLSFSFRVRKSFFFRASKSKRA